MKNVITSMLSNNHYGKEYFTSLKIFCEKIIPFVHSYKKQISSYNCTSNRILHKISLILPYFSKARKENRGVINSLITGCIGLAYEDISSSLHNKRQKVMHKSFIVIENKVN